MLGLSAFLNYSGCALYVHVRMYEQGKRAPFFAFWGLSQAFTTLSLTTYRLQEETSHNAKLHYFADKVKKASENFARLRKREYLCTRCIGSAFLNNSRECAFLCPDTCFMCA